MRKKGRSIPIREGSGLFSCVIIFYRKRRRADSAQLFHPQLAAAGGAAVTLRRFDQLRGLLPQKALAAAGTDNTPTVYRRRGR